MDVIYHPGVFEDITEAVNWYYKEDPTLVKELAQKIDSGFHKITDTPETWPNHKRGFKKFLVDKFPYIIFYKIKTDHIKIFAVAHTSRKPNYWLKRVK